MVSGIYEIGGEIVKSGFSLFVFEKFSCLNEEKRVVSSGQM